VSVKDDAEEIEEIKETDHGLSTLGCDSELDSDSRVF
jgi:hypothetical protein